MLQAYRHDSPGSAVKWFWMMACLLDLNLMLPGVAGAYSDPNIGSLIFQILFPVITVVSTAYLFCKNYLKRKYTSLRTRWQGGGSVSKGQDS